MKNRIFTRQGGRWLAFILVALSLASALSWADDVQKADTGRAKTVLAAHGKYIDERIAEFMTTNNLP